MISEKQYSYVRKTIPLLTHFCELATDYSDSFASFSSKGSGSREAYSLLAELLEITKGVGVEVDFDDSKIELSQIEELIEENDFTEEWSLSCHKPTMFNSEQDSIYCVIFCSEDALNNWLEKIDPFLPSCPVNKYTKLVIFVDNFDYVVKTQTLVIQGLKTNKSFPTECCFGILPGTDEVHNTIHLQASSDVEFSPINFVTTDDSDSCACAYRLNFFAAQVLASMLSSSFNKNLSSRLEICGKKSVSIYLTSGAKKEITNAQIWGLAELVSWAYEEKKATRFKLVHDRMSFDLNEQTIFVDYCVAEAFAVLKSVKEQYNYILADLCDAFESGKRKFLSDLKDVAEKYRSKLNSMLSSITRDFLAVVAILVLTIAPKVIASGAFENAKFLSALTMLLSAYILLSGILQFVLNLYECREMQRVVKLWLSNTNAYLNKEEVAEYIDKYTRGPRIKTLIVSYIFLGTYLIMAVAVFHSDEYVGMLADKEQTNSNVPKKTDYANTDENAGVSLLIKGCKTNLFMQGELVTTGTCSISSNRVSSSIKIDRICNGSSSGKD